ncbi:MAG: undecaprenyldiphospho-muramoylpentapeptide beta-N-acetylglucosaminyltransferase [Eubacteriales bacterium]
MRILFTCGGTGGHINPAIAVAREFQKHHSDCQILFVGAEGGMECNLVPREGFAIKTVKISNFRRKLNWDGITHNLQSLSNMVNSQKKAKAILKEFQPDVIVGTGGYASYPALKAGAKMGIPTAVHESNAVAGLTTKMVAKKADCILLNFEDAKADYHNPERIQVVGMPVRDEFLFGDRQKARAELGLDERPYIVSCWGSLGAKVMNEKMADFMVQDRNGGLNFQMTHATGKLGWTWMPAYLKDNGVANIPSLKAVEYVYNMPTQMAAADLVIARAGAATIAEICAAGTPCILVPSPNVVGDHQMKNAKILERHGAAVVLEEANITGESLYQLATELLNHPEDLVKMKRNLHKLAVVNSAERIYQAVMSLI